MNLRNTFLDSGGRNPSRISEILIELEKTWQEMPDLRLGQLVYIATGKRDIFNIEDDELLDQIITMRRKQDTKGN